MVSNSFAGLNDTDLLASMAQDDERAFTELYERYWKIIYGYAYNRLRDPELCKEIIQNIFSALWERRSVLKISSVPSYLFRSVKNAIIDAMNETSRRRMYADRFYSLYPSGQLDNTLQEQQDVKHLEEQIARSLSHLPDYYGRAFKLSRMEHLTSAEIAKRMNISVRTADNYITHALKHLRGTLGEMMAVVWLVLTGW